MGLFQLSGKSSEKQEDDRNIIEIYECGSSNFCEKFQSLTLEEQIAAVALILEMEPSQKELNKWLTDNYGQLITSVWREKMTEGYSLEKATEILKKRHKPEEGGLVYAVKNQIFLYTPEQNVLIAERENWVWALCSHDGQLYDGGTYNAIFETLSGRKVAGRKDRVWVLCSHEGQLYDGGRYNAVYETLRGKKVAGRSDWVGALCSHDGQLYDSGDYKAVYETLTGKKIAKRKNSVLALCSHGRQLYDGGRYNSVYETLSNKEVIKATGLVTALCSVSPETVKQILEQKVK